MAKRESTFGNMVLTLFVVTLVAAAALGFVNDFTKDAIEASKLQAKLNAIKSVLPAFEEIKGEYKIESQPGQDSLEVYPAYNGDTFVGLAIKTYTNTGFSGYISIMAGIGADGNFTGYEILEHKETPGLGSKMGVWFRNEAKPKQNVLGKNPTSTKFQVSKDGGDIDAITASTITSRAFLDALNRAYNCYEKNKTAPIAEENIQIKEEV